MKNSEYKVKLVLGQFIKYIGKHKTITAALFSTVVAASFFMRFAPPLIIAAVLDKLARGDFSQENILVDFGYSALLYLGSLVLGGIILWRLAIILLWMLELKTTRDIHRDIFSKLMTLDLSFHANRFGGSLVSQANKYSGAYVRLMDTTVFNVMGLLLAFTFTSIILWPQAPLFVIFMWIISITFILISLRITRKIRSLSSQEAAKQTKQTGFLADMVTNIAAVKSFAANTYENKRYAKATQETVEAGKKLMRASMKVDIFYSSTTALISVGALIIAILSVVLWQADVAIVFLVVSYTSLIARDLWDFGQGTLRNYNRSIGDAQEMSQILEIEPTVVDAPDASELKVKDGNINIKSVAFQHEGSEAPIFNNFLLDIPSGQKVGLVGKSGSGKTTLTRILIRFSNLNSGTIAIDGQDISQVTQSSLHKNISYVPQEPMLFHRSLRENIAYGKPNATDDEVRTAARKANALEFIESLPHGFDTLVGERGVKLSGGQRQRVAIARAILKDAPILVLDEATSALDSESEKLIQEALGKLMQNRTSIVIAHRLSTIAKLDRIIVLDKGKIIEDGTHAELLAKNGTYAKLWSHQSGGFIEE